MKQKKVINYYASFYEVSKELNQKQFYEFNSAIFSVMFYEQHIDDVSFDDKLLSIAWTSVKHSLQASIDGFCSKQKIDYEDVLNKGVVKGVVKGVSNKEKDNDNDNDKGKEKDKEKIVKKTSINDFVPNAASMMAVDKQYPNLRASSNFYSLIDDFKDQAHNRAKPFKDLQAGFRNYLRKGFIAPAHRPQAKNSGLQVLKDAAMGIDHNLANVETAEQRFLG